MARAPVTAYVALGANLIDPVTQVRAALAALDEVPETRVVSASSLYSTEAITADKQPDYVNAVAALETTLTPDALLTALFEIENEFGRRRDFHHAPRTLDLDLLLYDDRTMDTQRLQLPHPRMHLRAFVMEPLLEIAPDCRIPGRGNAAAWLPAVSTQRIEKLAP